MSKAILVIDMPDSCSKCKFIYEFQGKKKCQLMNALNGGFSMISQNNFTVRRHEKCPLLQIKETNCDETTIYYVSSDSSKAYSEAEEMVEEEFSNLVIGEYERIDEE